MSNLDYDDYVGSSPLFSAVKRAFSRRICIGRLISGELKVGQEVGIQYGEEGELRKGNVPRMSQHVAFSSLLKPFLSLSHAIFEVLIMLFKRFSSGLVAFS